MKGLSPASHSGEGVEISLPSVEPTSESRLQWGRACLVCTKPRFNPLGPKTKPNKNQGRRQKTHCSD